MIQYLIAGEAALPLASNRQDFSQIGHVEVADTPRENLAGALEIVKTRDSILEWVLAASMQQVTVQPVGIETGQ
jgi:hypothetical protein